MTIERALMGTTDATGGGLYVEDVFSTYLYTGNGATQTITNGIDLTKGGLVWVKDRSNVNAHILTDTVRGTNSQLISNSTSGQYSFTDVITAFGASGFSLGADTAIGDVNVSPHTYASWTFRKAPKFFDVVTFTATGSPQAISHALGSTPGCIIIKNISNSLAFNSDWYVYHRSIGTSNILFLNSTSSAQGLSYVQSTSSSQFTFNTYSTDIGNTFVAYLFAHDAGGFGAAGTDSIVSCGSYAGNGGGTSNTANKVTLGWEPQYVLIKNITNPLNWIVVDVMRGMSVSADSITSLLNPNLTDSEATASTQGCAIRVDATGFTPTSPYTPINAYGSTYIYLAIRRPMKTPTSGASVFSPNIRTGDGAVTTNFPTDFSFVANRNGGGFCTATRLTGGNYLQTSATSAEGSASWWVFDSNTTFGDVSGIFGVTSPLIMESFKRAPGFFDVVCYAGNGATQNINHNLGVKPELMFIKGRNEPYRNWIAARQGTGGYLNTNGPLDAGNTFIDLTTKSTATTFEVNANPEIGGSYNYVAYLFASCPGVSKVGSYTGNGSSQTINCGFTAGARFVLVKRTDSTGDWYVWDTSRGISASTDPHLSLNTTAAEVTTDDSIDPDSTGFIVNQVSATNINVSSATYIYLAIA